MRGVKSDDLLAIVDFLYCGETNVYQENLDSFLAIAEELQLKGLMGKAEKDEIVPEETLKMTLPKKVKPAYRKEPIGPSQSYFGEQMADTLGGEVALTSNFSSGDLQELDGKCNSMMEKTSAKNARGYALYRCNVCGKEGLRYFTRTRTQMTRI